MAHWINTPPIKKFLPKNLLYLPKKNTQPKKKTPYNYRKRSNFSNKNAFIIARKSTLFQMCFEYNSTIFMLANINQSFFVRSITGFRAVPAGPWTLGPIDKGSPMHQKKKMMHTMWLSHFQVQGNLRQIECPSKNFYVTLQEAIRTLIQPFS